MGMWMRRRRMGGKDRRMGVFKIESDNAAREVLNV